MSVAPGGGTAKKKAGIYPLAFSVHSGLVEVMASVVK
jgi:hypothetical protein